MEREIILEMMKLLEKTGHGNITFDMLPGEEKSQVLESILMNIKALNARYDKGEALTQLQWLMNNYNIQIDELMERINA